MSKDKLLQRYFGAIATLGIISLLSAWNELPSLHEISNSWDGLLWGIADPVLTLDNLVCILAIGLLGVGNLHSRWIAIALIFANIIGTLIHLSQINLPFTEIAIAIVSITVGIVLVRSKQLNLLIVLMLTAIAGLLQGYFNCGSIMGAGTMPSVMYVFGAALTQYTVVMSTSHIGTKVSQAELSSNLPRKVGLVGFAICAVSLVSLTSWIN